MKTYIYILIMCLFSVLPMMAQEEKNDGIAIADSLMADSLMADSLLTDSISTLTVQERIDKLLDVDMFQTSQVGIMVYDLTADTLVYAHNERQTMRPASTMKLLTAITALDRLGESYRFSTQLKYKGQLVDNVHLPDEDEDKQRKVLVGDLVVVGGMDPRFGTDDMRAFIESLHKLRVDTIYGDIKADRSFKDTDMLGEGWCWDDKNPVLTPLLWNRGDNFLPKFQQMLRESGIALLSRNDIPKDSLGVALYNVPKQENKTLVTRFHSLDQVLTKMMKDSDNLYAESMFYQIAASNKSQRGGQPAKAKHAAAVMNALIKKVGLNPSRYRIADGSGLSLYNYQSAELQLQLLRYAYRNPEIYGHLYPSLPIAGVDGTLKKRMHHTKAENNVHAKTGTVEGVSSLSGYLTAANGNTLAFVIINNGIRHTSNARNFQDKVCIVLSSYL